MVTYQMHSKKYNVDYQFKFDDAGMIAGLEIMDGGVISVEARKDIFANVKGTVMELREFCTKHKIELIEVKQDLSFMAFWNKYAYKEGSKMECEDVWRKLSDSDKTQALAYVQRYNQSLQVNNVAKVYPVRYLKKKYWVK